MLAPAADLPDALVLLLPVVHHVVDYAPQMLPDIGLRHGKQDVAHQLPLRSTFGHSDVQISGRDIGDLFNDQRQQGYETADEEEPNLLRLAQTEPGQRERDEHDDGHVSAD